MADSDQPDTFYMPPMVMSFTKEHSSSIFSREPPIALTGWGHDRTDGPNRQQTDKPAIRNYVLLGTTTKTFGDADVGDIAHPSLIDDWDHTIKLLKQAQQTVWDFTIAEGQALAIVGNIDAQSNVKLKLVQHFSMESEKDSSLTFAQFMQEKSKYTNVIQPIQDNLAGNSVFKLVAPIQIYLPGNEQGSCVIEGSRNPAARVISEKMKYNVVKIFYNNMVRKSGRIACNWSTHVNLTDCSIGEQKGRGQHQREHESS